MADIFVGVESSNVARVSYDSWDGTLWIYFHVKRKGVIVGERGYYYTGVPQSVYDGLLAAPSKGTYVWQNIRGKYPYHEV